LSATRTGRALARARVGMVGRALSAMALLVLGWAEEPQAGGGGGAIG
jgi:hypothetical protein